MGIFKKNGTLRTPWIKAPALAMLTTSKCNKEAETSPATGKKLIWRKKKKPHSFPPQLSSCRLCEKCASLPLTHSLGPEPGKGFHLATHILGLVQTIDLFVFEFSLGVTYSSRHEEEEEDKKKESRYCLREHLCYQHFQT